MQQWEYVVVNLWRPLRPARGISAVDWLANQLNELGDQGWEMCGVAVGTIFMKRPHTGGPVGTRVSGDADYDR